MRYLVLLVLLAGCASQTEMACREEAGPKPDRYADALGLLGAAIQNSDPNWIDWQHKVNQCVADKEARR